MQSTLHAPVDLDLIIVFARGGMLISRVAQIKHLHGGDILISVMADLVSLYTDISD